MTISRNDTNRENARAQAGVTSSFFVGVGTDNSASTADESRFSGTPNGSLVLHAVNFSATVNSVNDGGMISFDRSAVTVDYTPLSALSIGTTVTYDLHAKDIVGWIGVSPDSSNLPNGSNGDVTYSQGNYYRHNGSEWVDEGGNYTAAGISENIFSSIRFQIGQGFEGRHLTVDWVVGTAAGNASQFVIGGTGRATDLYSGGTPPVTLSTVNNPANSDSVYAYSPQGSSEAVASTHGTLERLSNDTNIAQYNATGNETPGDIYQYNVVAVDASGQVAFASLKVRIVDESNGGNTGGNTGGGTTSSGVKSIDSDALAALSSPSVRIGQPLDIDLSGVMINPNGTGTLRIAQYVNCSAADFQVTGNRVRSIRDIPGDFAIRFEVV